MAKEKDEVIHITLKVAIAWVLGILFIISSIGFLIFGFYISGILLCLMALFALPKITEHLEEEYKIKLSAGIRIVTIIVLFAIYTYTLPPEDIIQQKIEELKPTTTSTTTPTTIVKRTTSIATTSVEKITELIVEDISVREKRIGDFEFQYIDGELCNYAETELGGILTSVRGAFYKDGKVVNVMDWIITNDKIKPDVCLPFSIQFSEIVEYDDVKVFIINRGL